MTRTWNTTGTCIVEIARDACPFDWLEPLLVGETAELVVVFRSRGYAMPATWESPAEGDDERTLLFVDLVQDGAADQPLLPDLAKDVFERFEDKVMAAELDRSDEC